jgi:hypothetical protein
MEHYVRESGCHDRVFGKGIGVVQGVRGAGRVIHDSVRKFNPELTAIPQIGWNIKFAFTNDDDDPGDSCPFHAFDEIETHDFGSLDTLPICRKADRIYFLAAWNRCDSP